MQLDMAALLQSRKKVNNSEQATTRSEQFLTGNERLSPADQLEIYRVQFWLRHTSTLLEDFPGLSGIIGQQAWQELIEEYLAEHPPDSFSLRDLGAQLPEFVRTRDSLPHRELCAEMSRLEWCYTELFDAPESAPLDFAKLGSIPEAAWETATMVMNPALHLLSLKYPVHELRRELREEQLAPSDSRRSGNIQLPEPAPCYVVLYRDHQRSLFNKPVPELAFRMLKQLVARAPLGLAGEHAVNSYPEAERVQKAEQLQASLSAWFADWGSRGWIVDVQPQ